MYQMDIRCQCGFVIILQDDEDDNEQTNPAQRD